MRASGDLLADFFKLYFRRGALGLGFFPVFRRCGLYGTSCGR
jgi:hypothetical protein